MERAICHGHCASTISDIVRVCPIVEAHAAVTIDQTSSVIRFGIQAEMGHQSTPLGTATWLNYSEDQAYPYDFLITFDAPDPYSSSFIEVKGCKDRSFSCALSRNQWAFAQDHPTTTKCLLCIMRGR